MDNFPKSADFAGNLRVFNRCVLFCCAIDQIMIKITFSVVTISFILNKGNVPFITIIGVAMEVVAVAVMQDTIYQGLHTKSICQKSIILK